MSKSKNEREEPQRRKTGWHFGLHHIIPSSRGGGESKKNIYPGERWGENYGEKHRALHTLFVNLTPEEIIERIKEYMEDDGSMKITFFITIFNIVSGKRQKLEPEYNEPKSDRRIVQSARIKRQNAWKIVFGEMNGFEAIDWIEREFIKKEWLISLPPLS